MFRWLRNDRPRKASPRDVGDAVSFLASVKTKFRTGGPDAVSVYAEGLGNVAGRLADRFGVNVADIVGANLTIDQMHAALQVLAEVAAQSRPKINTRQDSAKGTAHGVAGGCLLLAEFFRLLVMAADAPEQEGQAAANAALQYRAFISDLAEVAVNVRDPTTMI